MNETVATAAALLRAENISALVVKDVCRIEGNVGVGILTERDIARAIAEHGPAGANLKLAPLIFSIRDLELVDGVGAIAADFAAGTSPGVLHSTLITPSAID